MLRLKKSFLLSFFLLGLSCNALQAQSTTWEIIYNQIQLRLAAQAETLYSMVYIVDSTTRITDQHHKVKRAVSSRRMVNLNWPDDPLNTFLEMKINGRDLSIQDIKTEITHGPEPQIIRTPFHPLVKDQYQFTLKGATLYQDIDVWEITYKPKKSTERLSQGKLFIDQVTYDIVYMAYSPAKLPRMVKKMDAIMTYQYIRGTWVPETMILQGHIKNTFIFTLSEQHMEIKETFSDYLF